MLTARQTADYFIGLATRDEDTISNLKVQKLVYYAQGFTLAMRNERLFADRMEAWKHGPVVPSLFHELKEHGAREIPPPAEPPQLDAADAELLEEVWTSYGQFSAWRLADLTHEEAPWQRAWERREKGGSAEILDSDLREFFLTRLES